MDCSVSYSQAKTARVPALLSRPKHGNFKSCGSEVSQTEKPQFEQSDTSSAVLDISNEETHEKQDHTD